MSKTYSIACSKCKKHLWIGQGSYGDGRTGHIYSGNYRIMDRLWAFLKEHEGHSLEFGENCEGHIGDYEEIEPMEEEHD